MRLISPDECGRAWIALKAKHAWLFSGEHIGHYCPPGWLSIAERLCAQLDDAIPDDARDKIWFAQVKEKYGQLRAYLNVAPLRFDAVSEDALYSTVIMPEGDESEDVRLYRMAHDLIMRAEEASARTCQWCGLEPASTRKVGWLITTACDRHADLDYNKWSEST